MASKKLSKASETMELADFKGSPVVEDTVLDINEISIQEYNIRKALDNYFVPIEDIEKESVSIEIRISTAIDDIRRFKKSIYQPPNIEELRTKLKEQEWSEILSMTDRLLYHLGNDVLPQFINQLVLATDSLSNEVQHFPYLFNVFSALNLYYKDIMVYHQLGYKIEAIKRAQRCKDILELGIQISETNKLQGLEPLKSSEFEKIDEIDGRPVYTFKQ